MEVFRRIPPRSKFRRSRARIRKMKGVRVSNDRARKYQPRVYPRDHSRRFTSSLRVQPVYRKSSANNNAGWRARSRREWFARIAGKRASRESTADATGTKDRRELMASRLFRGVPSRPCSAFASLSLPVAFPRSASFQCITVNELAASSGRLDARGEPG